MAIALDLSNQDRRRTSEWSGTVIFLAVVGRLTNLSDGCFLPDLPDSCQVGIGGYTINSISLGGNVTRNGTRYQNEESQIERFASGGFIRAKHNYD